MDLGFAKTLFLILMIVYLAVTVIFGNLRAKKQDEGTTKDWFAAGGKVAWAAVGFTIAAAWLDMATIFLNAGEGYYVGFSAFWYLAGAEMIAFLFVAFLFNKRIRATKMISQGEMLEVRYGKAIRPWYGFIWFVALCGYAALSFLVFNEFMQYVFGLSQWVSALICLVIVLAFQLLGGFASTVYADYIQGALIIIASVILGVCACNAAGGWATVAATVPADFLKVFGGETFGGFKAVATITVPLVLAFTIEPTIWVRIVSCRNLKDSRKAPLFAFLVYIPVCLFTLVAGCAAYALYPSWDLSINMLPVDMAVTLFQSPVIIAIIFVGIIAALISSFNAFMTAANLELCYDFIPPVYTKLTGKPFPENKYRSTSRWGMLVIGILGTFIALWLPSLVTILQFSGALGASGLFLPVFCMFFCPKVKRAAAILSFSVGSLSQLFLFIFGGAIGLNVDAFFISFPLAFIALLIGQAVGKVKPTEANLAPFRVNKDTVVE